MKVRKFRKFLQVFSLHVPVVDNEGKELFWEELERHIYWMEALDRIEYYRKKGFKVLLTQKPQVPDSEYNWKEYAPIEEHYGIVRHPSIQF